MHTLQQGLAIVVALLLSASASAQGHARFNTITITSTAATSLSVNGGADVAGAVEVGGTSGGVAAFAGDRYSHVLVAAGLNANPLTAIHQVGFYAAQQCNSNIDGITGFCAGFESAIGLNGDAFTPAKMAAFAVGQMTSNGTSTATRTWNVSAVDQTLGTNNAVLAIWDSTFTGNWFIYYEGARPSRLGGGDLIVGTEIYRTIDTGFVRLAGGSAAGTGGHIALFGSTHATQANKGQLVATGGWTVIGDLLLTSNPAGFGITGDGTNGLGLAASHASGALRFASGGTVEVGRFDSTGQFFLGTTVGVVANPRLGVAFSGAGNFGAGLEVINTGNTSGAIFANFVANGVLAGTITRVGTTAAVNYNAASDARLKHDLGLASDLAGLRALRVHDFAWKSDGTRDRGVFAQEAYLAIGRGVTPGTTGSDLSQPWMVDKSAWVPDLIVGFQEHDRTIARLAARIAALEGRH